MAVNHLPRRLEQLRTETELPPKPFLNEYLPSADEIRLGCLQEQKKWTDAEWRKRGGAKGRRKSVEIPVVKVHAHLD